ncbi:magnesium/cobalt transporter CorA [Picosynechococcus sp. NKBG15041c]|uniref:magnesium/cobalt transporter CorA n=1 Tax=Picosynechococcus sp. NKBG15041c TaxID=1407650 RepID=UPI0009DBF51B|nr:magnesium/cobalt transporter CorA [Picosynechococcus sp. NKBG15041c]
MPGTLRIEPNAAQPRISLIDYNEKNWFRVDNLSPEECSTYLNTESVSWIDVGGIGDSKVYQKLGDLFQLHPLILEDIVNVPQRPKIEEHDNQLLIISQMVVSKPNNAGFWLEQVSFILSRYYLLTVQEEPEEDCFERIRDRLKLNKGSIRKQGADFLAYALWDAIIDGFFPVLEILGDRIEALEDEVVINPTPQTLSEIHQIKRELLALRRAIWPQRDALNTLIRDGSPLINNEVSRYFRDCYDHTITIIDVIETYRELASGLMDVYLSAVSNKMNEVMQLLTVISTIFIPLTFIAGIYGMNFNTEKSRWNMPELNWSFGYAFCLGIMGAIAIVLLFFFWRKGWLKIRQLD